MKNSDDVIFEMYLDYFNNFLTVGAFADYYAIPDEQAQDILAYGRKYF